MQKHWTLISALVFLGIAFWWSPEIKTIAAGVAIFLFGMLFLETGFKSFTGGILERLLRRSTNSLWRSQLFGLASTALMQSSSLVSVVTISFLSAGLIGLAAGIGIIFGANIGTTTGAWLMAGFGVKVQISAYAMPMLVFGLILSFQKKKTLRGAGNILAGLGFLFLGIHYMKEGFETFRETIDLSQYAVGGYPGLFLFTGIGVVATVIMQSSHATLMLIIAGLAAGQITYENALALAIGANIGTTITAILGSISANIAGKRLALAHLIFNTVTALIAIVLIGLFRWSVDEIAILVGIAQDDWTLKLAIFHTLFNLIGVLVMMPFIPLLVQVLENRVRPSSKEALMMEPLYLNESAIGLPDTALEVLVKESMHLFDNAFEIIAHGLNLHRLDILSGQSLDEVVARSQSEIHIEVTERYYKSIKTIYNAIVDFATRASTVANMNEAQVAEMYNIRIVCRNIAEIVKTISHMRDNMTKYIASDNFHIRDQYNRMRKVIAYVLRMIFRIRDSTDETVVFITLSELKEKLERNDILADGTFDRLVREDLITIEMATSLMNDSAFTTEIGQMLIEIAERLFIAQGTDLKALEETLLRQESDFSEITN